MKIIHTEILQACLRKWTGSRGRRRRGKAEAAGGGGSLCDELSHWLSWRWSFLLQALLEQAQDAAYDVATEPKLCVHCDEYVFMEVVRCANVPDHAKLLMCT